jgi:predicted Zn-dependent protease
MAVGTLTPQQWSLRFEAEGCEVELPFQDLEIHFEDAGRICFRHPEFPDWSLYTSDERILRDRLVLGRTPLREQIEEANRRGVWRNALLVTGAALVGFALLSVLVSWLSGLMVRAIAAQIPASWEKQYGDKVFAELKEELKPSEDAELLAQLKQATDPLLGVVKSDFQFHLVEEDIPNAFALPGGHVVVFTGIVKLADTPEQLAGVLAHELAHVTQKHHFRRTIAAQGPYYITRVFFQKSGLVTTVLAVGSQVLITQNFSRKYEREADEVGWRYLVAANINPRGEIDLLKKLHDREAKSGMEGLTHSAFSSHPPTEERIQRLEAKWKGMKKQSGFLEFQKPEGN